jgi:hypothetical protein
LPEGIYKGKINKFMLYKLIIFIVILQKRTKQKEQKITLASELFLKF